MQPVMAGAAVACLGGREMARLCGIPCATGRSELTPTGEAQAAVMSPLSRMESAVCTEPPPYSLLRLFYLSCGTLLPCAVLFVSKFKHCNVCCSWCFLGVWTQAGADACWIDEVFSTVGPLGTGSGKARTWGGMHGSAAWAWQEGVCSCWAVAPQDKTSLSLREALSKMLLQGFRRWKQ